ncbi:hypothetical protein EZ55_04239 (plasmid) [Alteromonas macleodii]|nr:hypothetical protein EZ55_04239 [Alteromonas macleodii]VTP58248.1 hypothetical protein EZ55_04239 [Alteromonas macleodii]
MDFGYNNGHEFNGFHSFFQRTFLLGPGRGECRVAGAVGRSGGVHSPTDPSVGLVQEAAVRPQIREAGL